MKRSALAGFLVLSLALAVACGGGQNVKTDEPKNTGNAMHGQATGMAAIYDGDKGLARDRATLWRPRRGNF